MKKLSTSSGTQQQPRQMVSNSTNNGSSTINNGPSCSNSTNKPQRTIQVKFGNQAAKSMTPDQAADYLKSIAASTNGFFGSSGAGAFGGGALHREVKMTFDNGTTSTVALPRVLTNATTGSSSSITVGAIKNAANLSNCHNGGASMNASKSTAASLLFNSTVRSSNNNNSINTSGSIMNPTTNTRADGMPCSEKEMKALMSMFVEIMGLQMNTERLNQVSSLQSNKTKSKKSPTASSKEEHRKVDKSSSKATSGTTGSAKTAEANPSNTTVKLQHVKKPNKKSSSGSSSCLKITTTQKIGPNEVITATMSTSLPANLGKDTNLFQFPTDLPPPPGGWPEDLLWPDKNNPNKRHKIIIRNSMNKDKPDDYCLLSDVDDDDDDDHHTGKEGETVVVITTTTVDDDESYNDEDDEDEDDVDVDDVNDVNDVIDVNDVNDEDVDHDMEEDEEVVHDTEAGSVGAESLDSLPGLEVIPDNERPVFRVWQQQQRVMAQKQLQQMLALQKRHERKMMLSLSSYVCNDDDDDITLSDDGIDSNIAVTGVAGIVPFDWEALEDAAMEDALEQEERIRKETSIKQQQGNGNTKSGNKHRNQHNYNTFNHPTNIASSNNSMDSGTFSDGPHQNQYLAHHRNEFYNHSRYNHQQQQAEYNSFKAKVDAANKKLGKAVVAWRNRVAGACQSNEPTKLQQLFQGSTVPFHASAVASLETTSSSYRASAKGGKNNNKNNKISPSDNDLTGHDTTRRTVDPAMDGITVMSEEDRLVQQQFLHPHLELLVPYCVPKIRQLTGTKVGQQCREMLTSFLLRQSAGLYFLVQPVLKAGTTSNSIIFGRSAFDTACFFGDASIIRLIIPELLKHYESDRKAMSESMSDSNNNDSTNTINDVDINGQFVSSYHNFLHQTCHDSGWTPLHYAAISGSLHTVELLLQCDYAMNYNKPATFRNKTYQLLPILYIESNDTLTWRKPNALQQHGGNCIGSTIAGGGKNNNSFGNNNAKAGGAGNRGGGISARQLVEFVKNGQYKKELESHGMALEEIIDHFYLNDGNNNTNGGKGNKSKNNSLERIQYLALLNLIHERLFDCEMNGYHIWDSDTIETKVKKALSSVATEIGNSTNIGTSGSSKIYSNSPVSDIFSKSMSNESVTESNSSSVVAVSTSQSVATNSTVSKQAGHTATTKKTKNKKSNQQQPDPSFKSNMTTTRASKALPLNEASLASSSHNEDPVVTALLGMGFSRDQIMHGFAACGGADRATVDDVVAWIFGGCEGGEEPIETKPAPIQETRTASTSTKSSTDERQEKAQKAQAAIEEERVVAQQKLAAKREEARRRNREWNNRAQARQLQEDNEKLAKAAVDVPTPVSQGTASAKSRHPTLRTGTFNVISPLGNKLGTRNETARHSGSITTSTAASTSTMAATIAARAASSNGTTGKSTPGDGGMPIVLLKRNSSNAKGTGTGLSGKMSSAVHPTVSNVPLAPATPIITNANSEAVVGCDTENLYSNDTSSGASSNEYNSSNFPPMMRSNIIEVSNNNDDATVSTIESTPAIIIQQLPSSGLNMLHSATYFAPPGFDQNTHHNMGDSNTAGAGANSAYGLLGRQQPMSSSIYPDGSNRTAGTLVSRQQWDDPDDLCTPYTISDLNLSAPAYIPSTNLKSYHHHLYDHVPHGSSSVSATMNNRNTYLDHHHNSNMSGDHQLRMPLSSSTSSSRIPDHLAPPNHLSSYTGTGGDRTNSGFTNNDRGFLGTTLSQLSSVGLSSNTRDHHHHGIDPSLIAGAFASLSTSGIDYGIPHGSIDPTQSSTTSNNVVPGLNFENFGCPSDLTTRYEPHIESSLIESISTGTAALPWDESSSTNRAKSVVSSILLGNVIGSSSGSNNNTIDDPFISSKKFEHLVPFTNDFGGNGNQNSVNVGDPLIINNTSLQQRHHNQQQQQQQHPSRLTSIGVLYDPPSVICDEHQQQLHSQHHRNLDGGLDSWLGSESSRTSHMHGGGGSGGNQNNGGGVRSIW